MTDTNEKHTPIPKYYMALSIAALLWSLLWLYFFLTHMLMSEEGIAGMEELKRELYESTPVWHNEVFGLAVIPGLLGAIGLLVKKEFATLFFLISLIAVLLHQGYAIFMTDTMNVMGPKVGVLALATVLISCFLYYFSMVGINRGWLTDID